MGARPMARVIQEHIKRPLAEELLFGRLENGGHAFVSVGEDGAAEGRDRAARMSRRCSSDFVALCAWRHSLRKAPDGEVRRPFR